MGHQTHEDAMDFKFGIDGRFIFRVWMGQYSHLHQLIDIKSTLHIHYLTSPKFPHW